VSPVSRTEQFPVALTVRNRVEPREAEENYV
jgi:hypothetical protein